MAGSLGEAQLQLTVDQTAFSTGLSKAAAEASRKGAQIQKALESRQARVDGNQELVKRLQKEALSADASRKALIAQRIGYIRLENAEQAKGIAILKAKLAENNKLVDSYRQAGTGAQSAFRKLNGVTVGLSAALGGLFAGAGAGAFLKSAINEAVQLEAITRKLANTLGKDGAGTGKWR